MFHDLVRALPFVGIEVWVEVAVLRVVAVVASIYVEVPKTSVHPSVRPS